jgi:hypothetical protein
MASLVGSCGSPDSSSSTSGAARPARRYKSQSAAVSRTRVEDLGVDGDGTVVFFSPFALFSLAAAAAAQRIAEAHQPQHSIGVLGCGVRGLLAQVDQLVPASFTFVQVGERRRCGSFGSVGLQRGLECLDCAGGVFEFFASQAGDAKPKRGL